MQDYLNFLIERRVYITLLMELLAALAGNLYLFKKQKNKQLEKKFVWFLWSVFIIDLLGGYSIWAYFDNYQSFPFLKDSLFTRNFWWFNIARAYFFVAYVYFLEKQIKTFRLKLYIKGTTAIFVLFAVYNMIFSGQFFTNYIINTIIAGTLLIITTIFAYFYDMLIGERLLNFYKSLFFYVALGVFIWYLVIPPVEIYATYFTEENKFFIEVYATVVRYANVFMYSIFIFGFYMDYRFRRKTTRELI